MRKSIAIIFIIQLVVSCKSVDNSNYLEIRDFNIKYNLSSDQGYELTFMPNCIGLIDSILIMDNAKEPFIVFLDTSNYVCLSKFGFKGKGPNEFIYLKNNNDIVNNGTNIWVTDPNRRLLFLYNINDLLSNKKIIVPIQKEYLSPLTAIETSIVNVGDSIVIGGSYSNSGQIFIFNKISKTVKWIPYSDVIKHEKPSNELGQLYYGTVRKKPDETKIVCGLKYFKEIIILDTKTKQYTRIKINQPEQHLPKANIDLDYLQSINCMYYDIYCTNRHIYALFLNVTSKELVDSGFETSEIHVFNYNGKPIAQLFLGKAINKIAVDENKGVIFGFNKFQNSTIYKFNLPNDFLNSSGISN